MFDHEQLIEFFLSSNFVNFWKVEHLNLAVHACLKTDKYQMLAYVMSSPVAQSLYQGMSVADRAHLLDLVVQATKQNERKKQAAY